MKCDESLQQVECYIHRLPVAKALGLADELVQPLAVDELSDQVPLAGAGLAGPEDLHHMRMTNLSQRPELTADRVIAGRVVEQLQSPLLALNVVADPVDLSETTLVHDL